MLSEKEKMSANKVFIDGNSLTIEDVVNVARNNYQVELDPSALKGIEASHAFINEAVDKSQVIYGVTTGFGSLSSVMISPEDTSRLSRNIIVSHSVAVGNYLPDDYVRAGMLVRVNALAKGHSGVQLATIQTMIDMLNKGVTPLVPEKGSLACSGDLCLLAHVARVFTLPIDEDDTADGLARFGNEILAGKDAMERAGIPRVKLGPKEGLAVTNGSTFTVGIACLLHSDISMLAKVGCASLALSMEALKAVPSAFDDRIHQARNHEGQITVAKYVRKLIEGSTLISNENRVQDAYSLRCAAQAQGPLFDALETSKKVFEAEINAATDNPLIFDNCVLSGGNFHGEPIGIMSDYLKIVLSELGSISHIRTTRIVSKDLSNGLPSMLAKDAGLNSGYMIVQYTSAALHLDCQHEATPDVINSNPTCENQEDHNSNSMNSVLHLRNIVSNVRKILDIEILCAVRGIQLRLEKESKKLSFWSTKAYSTIISKLGPNEKDHALDSEIDSVDSLLDKLVTEDDLEDKFRPNQRNVGVPRGFRDFHPHEMRVRKEVFSKIEKVFKLYGAPCIETPILELKSVLFGQYGDQGKLVFDLNDQGGSMCSLRYDLTVPLSRYIAQNGLSHFKRYQIGPVFRRDAPNIAKGRYRSFYQCDFDVVGDYDTMVPDAEVLTIMSDILKQFPLKFTLKFNHKELLDHILSICNVPPEKYMTTCSSIDKLDKEPWDNVANELREKGLSEDAILLISKNIQLSGNPRDILSLLRERYPGIPRILDDIELLFNYLEAFGSLSYLTFDLTLCRGLSYYTGIIFEAVLLDNEVGVGSIGGGGRYDKLIGTFGKSDIPAVGGSIGVERLFAIMEARESFDTQSDIQVYVTYMGEKMMKEALAITSSLRSAGIITEFPYKRNKMKDQIESVLKRGIPYMVLVGEDEFANGEVLVKDIQKSEQHKVTRENLTNYLSLQFSNC